MSVVFFFQAEDGIRDIGVTGVQTCALPISGDELAAEVAEQRARGYEVLDAWGVGAESHHLDGADEDVVEAAEDSDAEDRAREVAAGFLCLLAQRRSRLEPGKREEPEHYAEEDRRRADAARYREHREV